MFRPVAQATKDLDDLLPWISSFFPSAMKNFCVFVMVEGQEKISAGAGTITDDGIFTAAHIFSFPFFRIFVTFYIDDCHYITIPANRIIHLDADLDVAVIDADIKTKNRIVPSLNKLSSLPETAEIWIFGCPQFIYGITWQPQNFILTDNHFITQGILIPGISGGGVFVRNGKKWHLWAINSYGYTDSKTLYSTRLW